MQKIRILLFVIILTGVFTACKTDKVWEINSPNGKIEVEISQCCESGDLSYLIQYFSNGESRIALEKSALGLEREDTKFSKLQFIEAIEKKNIKDEYQLLSGKKLNISTVYNEIVISFTTPENNLLNVIFRAYDDGIAFSYMMPETSDKYYRVSKELTSFNLPEGHAWMAPYDTVTTWSPGYETYYDDKIAIGTPAIAKYNGWGFPMLFETNQLWMLISEAGFDGTYGAVHLKNDCTDGNYQVTFAPEEECMGYYENTSYNTLPWQTPWRTIIIGDQLSTIVESNMVTHLAQPCKLKDLSWVKPGRASWSWCMFNDSPQDYDQLVPFVDLAAKMGWEYSLVDANWNFMKNGNIEKLVQYANTKNVGLILWYNSGDKHNIVPEEPRDLMFNRKIRRAEFKRIHELGIKGIKVDFFQSDKQTIINQYIEILEDAAEFEILVNFHGCTIPKGWRRTYPNLISMEAIRGGECYIFAKDYPEKAPKHLSLVPFLRNVVGPCDYTPGGFSDNILPHLTSFGFELAIPVVIESGITHYTETPKGISALPDFAVKFLSELPVVWDETKLISGYPGENAVMARRSGETWYIGGINGTQETKTFHIDLSDLGVKGKTITIISDGDDFKKLQIKKTEVDQAISVKTLKYGGFVAKIE
ncbi:MAG: glycoside hydrolase family 97 catalytic domain-containing protein [Prolixibacteraceae bacterium]